MARPKRSEGAKIVDQCMGCCLPDYTEGYCTAFDDPAYQWRNGKCWGRCGSPQEMVKRLEAMAAYNAGNGAAVTAIRRELRDWQETVMALAEADMVV